MKNTFRSIFTAAAITTALTTISIDASAMVPAATAGYSENAASVQSILTNMGYYKAPVTGVMDAPTRAALQTFQAGYGLPSTGMIDNATATALNTAYTSLQQGTPATMAAQPADAAYSSNALAIQKILKSLGFITFEPNGYMDGMTRAAIAKFQSVNNLLVNGEVDVITAEALNRAYESGLVYQNAGVGKSPNEPYRNDQSWLSKYKWGLVGGGALAAGGIALAAGGGGSGSSGSSEISFGIASNDSGTDNYAGGFTAANFDNPASGVASSFLTAETDGNEGIENLRANFAHARGYDGRVYNRNANGSLKNATFDDYIIVGVVDSGVDSNHPDLVNNLLLDYDVTCTASGCVAGSEDEEGHGTIVAGIIAAERNSTGTSGIAPRAKILPLKNDLSEEGAIYNYNYAYGKGVDVYNNSYGYGIPIVTATTPGTLDDNGAAITTSDLRLFMTANVSGTSFMNEFQKAVAADTLFVWAAGNEGANQSNFLAALPYYFSGTANSVNTLGYNWSNHWVNVVSVNDSNVISSFSNRCGVTMEWCLAAPGEIASTTEMGGGYTGVDGDGDDEASGTSFAAPNVSGALAVLLGAYPHLQPEDALDILFETATDLGVAGTDAIYGRGLVNLDAATNPTGNTSDWALALAGNLNNNSFSSASFSNTGINLSAAFGDAMRRNAQSLIFLDKFKKDYTVSLNSMTGTTALSKSADELLGEFGSSQFANTAKIDGKLELGFTLADDSDAIHRKSVALAGDVENQRDSTKMAMRYSVSRDAESKESVDTFLSYNVSAADTLGFSATANANKDDVLLNNAFKNPYLAIADSATSMGNEYKVGDVAVKFAVFDGKTEKQQYEFAEDNGVSGYMTEVSLNDSKNLSLSLQSGVNTESATFLGSEAGGALNLSDDTKTYYTGMAASYNLMKDVYLNANYNFGVTSLATSGNSLINNISDVKSNSFAVGAEVRNVYDSNDRFGFSVAQPLRVSSASGMITLPQDVNADGSIVYETSKLSLNPQGQELDIQAFYDVRVDGGSALSLGSMLRMEPDHIEDADSEGLFLMRYKTNF